jgi:4-amino-4-deoxy-L-arabinose transferase-like glycosyltransferase
VSDAVASRRRAAWAAVWIAAAIARLVFAGAVVGFDTPPKADEADYHAIAASLGHGDGFAGDDGQPTARRPPAYPAFLAALYAVTGESPRAGRIAQVILGVVVVALTGALARRFFDGTTALVAAALAAVNPFLIFLSGYLLTENLYLVLLLTALVVARDPRDLVRERNRALAVGLLLGLAALARPSGLPMFEWVLAAMLLLSGAPWRGRVAHAVIAVVAFTLVVLPWHARNHAVVGGWVLTTHGGITFLQGNNDKVAGVPQWRGGAAPLQVLPRFDELSRLDELSRDQFAWQLGKDYLRAHPRDVPGLVFWKMVRFWRLRSDMGLSGIRSGWWFDKGSTLGRLAANLDVGFVYAVIVIPCFVVGWIMTRARWRELSLVTGVVVVHTAIAAIFFGSLRTRIPLEPVMCVFAAVVVVALWRRAASRVSRVRSS